MECQMQSPQRPNDVLLRDVGEANQRQCLQWRRSVHVGERAYDAAAYPFDDKLPIGFLEVHEEPGRMVEPVRG